MRDRKRVYVSGNISSMVEDGVLRAALRLKAQREITTPRRINMTNW